VSMRDEYGADTVFAFFEIFGIGEDEVDARGFRIIELKPHIYDDNIIPKLDKSHIAPNLLDTAQADYANAIFFKRR